MRAEPRLGFKVSNSAIKNNIYIPKYYDPEIGLELDRLADTHHLISVGELIERGELAMQQGNYIGKIHYGTGSIPYIRTSDIANWELRGSPKHGVSDDVWERFRKKQDIQENDILLVHEGTYLIGTCCLLTRFDTEILYQHHLARLRVVESELLTGPLLMAALLAPVVQRQIRSRQFTADVIDSIVGRFLEVVLPIPKSHSRREKLSEHAKSMFTQRAEARVMLAALRRELDIALAEGWSSSDLVERVQQAPDVINAHSVTNFLGSKYTTESFTLKSSEVKSNILLPRYYDPEASKVLQKMSRHCDLVTVGDLAAQGVIDLETGDEVGKLAYGGGDIPFIRTSDLGNWELKFDPKQKVSRATFEQYKEKQSARPEDILLVRDGTYLVGTSSMIMPADCPLLYSGGIYRIRVTDRKAMDPYLLLALLNTEVAGRQMRNKQFTRDVIDTLGRRIEEVVLPVPRDLGLRESIADLMRDLLQSRTTVREKIRTLGTDLVSTAF